jgi:hypothetical protein
MYLYLIENLGRPRVIELTDGSVIRLQARGKTVDPIDDSLIPAHIKHCINQNELFAVKASATTNKVTGTSTVPSSSNETPSK